ncbi:hypothetical protein DAPPUDRAFT_334917 [Daphnia pulex]|uniref:Uncharacterized protein n=1 Tax=Daphnia pulex TaxID=6669 RepID=E9HWN4_DAPPU|nr:hypothetical protein DAPPUDRAFT_334917 [Daphnia pulex]|eukprot:EFX63847.1 hypothetical protein DAPPUDRAFT_334917 [Daphnia pulex]
MEIDGDHMDYEGDQPQLIDLNYLDSIDENEEMEETGESGSDDSGEEPAESSSEWKWSPRDDVVAEEVNDDDSIAELERSFAASTIDLTMDEDVNLLEEDEGRKVKRLSEEGAEPTGSKRQKLE